MQIELKKFENFKFRRFALVFIGLTVLFVGGYSCKKKKAEELKATPEKVEATELSALFKELQTKLRSGDKPAAAQIARSFLPEQEDVESILAPGKENLASKISAFQKKFAPTSDSDAIKIFDTKKERTVIKVHRATTEDLVKNEKGTTSYNEFPSGILGLAGSILKPNTAFYEVEMLEPGKEMGMKYHLFVKTKGGWKMMGPIWRVFMKKEKTKSPQAPTKTPVAPAKAP